jgi:hypothetical protein
MYGRSALKKLLVHDGIGMALDRLRGDRIEMGAISREPHAMALKQVQSTGLDRFLSVLSATPVDAPWDPAARVAECLAFLERAATQSAFVSGEGDDLAAVGSAGVKPWTAAWAGDGLAGADDAGGAARRGERGGRPGRGAGRDAGRLGRRAR